MFQSNVLPPIHLITVTIITSPTSLSPKNWPLKLEIGKINKTRKPIRKPWTLYQALKDGIEDEMKWTVHIASGGDLQCTGTVIGSIFQHVLTHSSCCPSPSETNMVIVVSYGRSGKDF